MGDSGHDIQQVGEADEDALAAVSIPTHTPDSFPSSPSFSPPFSSILVVYIPLLTHPAVPHPSVSSKYGVLATRIVFHAVALVQAVT